MSSSLTASLQAFLQADATLTAAMPGGVWVEPAPMAVSEPFVVLELVGGTDEGFGGGPRHTGATYTIAAMTPAGRADEGRTAATQIDALLDYAAITTALSGFRVLGVRRVAPVDETYEDGTARWVRVGGEYQFWVEVT